jgi:hypothetical protein
VSDYRGGRIYNFMVAQNTRAVVMYVSLHFWGVSHIFGSNILVADVPNKLLVSRTWKLLLHVLVSL